jgi:hypothetical protein
VPIVENLYHTGNDIAKHVQPNWRMETRPAGRIGRGTLIQQLKPSMIPKIGTWRKVDTIAFMVDGALIV